MSIESAIVAILQADTGAGGVATLLTGGIYSKAAIGKLGIDKANPLTPNAYVLDDGFSVLRPLLVVKVRSLVPAAPRQDRKNQHAGANGVIELWFYEEEGYTTIASARDRAYTLLQHQTLAAIGAVALDNRIENLRAQELNDAALLRDDYIVVRKIGV